MNDRIQRALDGELERHVLTPAEAAELADLEAMIAGVVDNIAAEPMPDQSANVLRRIAELEATTSPAAVTGDARDAGAASATGNARSGPGSLLGWLWQPRTVSLQWRPAYAFAGLAAAMLLLMVQPTLQRDAVPVAVTDVQGDNAVDSVEDTAAVEPQVLVQFRLDAPDAEQVSLAGDFTDWQPAHTLTRSEPGIWTVVVPLDPGVHDYAFIVDGEQWVADPMAPAVGDGFGGQNSRLAVLTPDERRPL